MYMYIWYANLKFKLFVGKVFLDHMKTNFFDVIEICQLAFDNANVPHNKYAKLERVLFTKFTSVKICSIDKVMERSIVIIKKIHCCGTFIWRRYISLHFIRN